MVCYCIYALAICLQAIIVRLWTFASMLSGFFLAIIILAIERWWESWLVVWIENCNYEKSSPRSGLGICGIQAIPVYSRPYRYCLDSAMALNIYIYSFCISCYFTEWIKLNYVHSARPIQLARSSTLPSSRLITWSLLNWSYSSPHRYCAMV